jgi:hypothetical protein
LDEPLNKNGFLYLFIFQQLLTFYSLELISPAYQLWYNVFSHNKTAAAGLSAVKIISRTDDYISCLLRGESSPSLKLARNQE